MAKINIARDYPSTFWTANVMELFERAAYYGLNSVLGGYLTLSVAAGDVVTSSIMWGSQSQRYFKRHIFTCAASRSWSGPYSEWGKQMASP
jgi:dipeptide/tripeptide permease